MTAAALPYLPGYDRPSPAAMFILERTAAIEDLASKGASKSDTVAALRGVAHPSLTGSALWDAWNKAEHAIAVRDGTDPEDADYELYEERAADAVCDLIHGINISTARGSGITPRGTA